MKNPYYFLALLFGLSLFGVSCDPEEVEDEEQEVITTIIYTLTPSAGGDDVVLTFTDLDGDGGDDAVITGGSLSANTTYSGDIEILNESVSPTEDITQEILEEDEEHQFFFESSNSTLVTIAYNDSDPNGLPIGIETTLITGTAGSTDLTVILRHEPNKSGDNVSTGDITNAGGETDIEVVFPLDVQ